MQRIAKNPNRRHSTLTFTEILRIKAILNINGVAIVMSTQPMTN